MKKSANILSVLLLFIALYACSLIDGKEDSKQNNTEFFPVEAGKTWHYDVDFRTSRGEEEKMAGYWKVAEIGAAKGDSLVFSIESQNGPSFSEIGGRYMILGDTVFAEVLAWPPGVTTFEKHLVPPKNNDTLSYSVKYSYDYGISMKVFKDDQKYNWKGEEYDPAWVYVRSLGLGTDTLKFVKGLGFVYQHRIATIFTGDGSYESELKKELSDISAE